MRSLSYICFFLLFISCARSLNAPSVPSEILNGYFPGRSAVQVVAPKIISEGDSVVYLQSSVGAFQSQSINDNYFSDLVAHLMGISPINLDASRTHFPRTNIFRQPRANLFIAIDSVGEEDSLSFPGQLIQVKRTSYPSNSLSDLTTLASGSSPSTHGIVSSSWSENGKIIEAFGARGYSAVPNFADVLSAHFGGRSQIVVASGDRQMASALCPHSSQTCVYWDQAQKKSVALAQKVAGRMEVSEASVVRMFESTKLVQYNKEQKVVQMTDKAATKVNFHLDNKEDQEFLCELELLRSFRYEVLSHADTDARAPHYFAFAFSSLKGLVRAHGAHSPIVKVAVNLLHSEVLETLSMVNTSFERVVTEVVLLGTHQEAPSIDCKLDFSEFETHTIPKHRQVRSAYVFQNTLAASNNATVSVDDLTNFHIILWVSIALALLLITFVWTMSEVSSGQDTLLYSSASRPHAS